MKPTFPLPTILFAVLITTTHVEAQSSFIRGDCNSDSVYDISDPIRSFDELFASGPPVLCDDACDANNDGEKSLADGIYMLASLFQMGPPPPGPFPLCGVDQDLDGLGCDDPGGSGCLPLPPVERFFLEPPRPSTAFPCRCNHRDKVRPGEGEPTGASSSHLFSGEFTWTATDLHIKGRGLDFNWTRTYRSKVPTSGLIGNGWDHSYNIFIEEVFGGLLLHDGNGRHDLLLPDSDGIYRGNGIFALGEFDSSGRFVLTFPNHGRWEFESLSSQNPVTASAPGMIDLIVDRNGNEISFHYDGAGRLSTVVDTLGRPVEVSYDSMGRVGAVTDFTGRAVTYEYYGDGDFGGGAGDLRSSTSPAIVGTPTGNDFPAGKTTMYTYSSGFGDERLNHNLLSITDPLGQVFLQNTYAPTTDDSELSFDALVQQVWGGEVVHIHHETVTPLPSNNGASILCIVNDRCGHVKEFFYDLSNRCVLIREFTGQAIPNEPTTPDDNRPTNPLRPNDPIFFETGYQWTGDSMVKEIHHPNGNLTMFMYEQDLNPAGPPELRGNLREVHYFPGTHTPPGDQSSIVSAFQYQSGFGGYCAKHFVSNQLDPEGGATTHDFDANGNRLQTVHAIAGIVEDFGYNSFGQLTRHDHPSSAELPAVQRRRDEIAYFDSGPQAGYPQFIMVDTLGENLVTEYSYDAVGNLLGITDPLGRVTDITTNALDQVIHVSLPEMNGPGSERFERFFYYDANDNLRRAGVERLDRNGNPEDDDAHQVTLYEYDILGNLIYVCEETAPTSLAGGPLFPPCASLPPEEFTPTGYEYDACSRLAKIHFGQAAIGEHPDNVQSFLYDERGLLFQLTHGEGPGQSTDQYDYDANGNLIRLARGLENNDPREWLYTYDGYDRRVHGFDPMGNEAFYGYDSRGNVINERREGQTDDQPGSVENEPLSETDYAYDDLNRLVTRTVHHFGPGQNPIGDGQATTQYSYTDTSQIHRITDDNGNATTYTYDSLNRLFMIMDAHGNSRNYLYDGASQLTSLIRADVSTLAGVPVEVFSTSYVYDAAGRLTRSSDNAGNTQDYGYDSRGNLTLQLDARGNSLEHTYDGLGRLTATTRTMTDDGTGDGAVTSMVTTNQVWDASSRLIARSDDNGNLTQYAYDALNRLTATTHADLTTEFFSYDVHGNLIQKIDANGTTVFNVYDLLNRKILVDVAAGPGVSSDTTFEMYGYDGLSRMFHAEDDDSLVLFEHDSLSNVISESWPLTGNTVQKTYDGVGNLTSLFYPGGRFIQYFYDPLNRITQITDGAGNQLAGYEYIGPNRILRRDHGNDTRLDVAYDALQRVVGTTHTFDPTGNPFTLDDRAYEWDSQYNKTRRQELTPGSQQWDHQYAYDSLSRLIATDVMDVAGALIRATTYELDGVGNRVEVVDDSCNGNYVMSSQSPPADFQMNQYTATGCDSRTYDEAGNLTSFGPAGLPSKDLTYDYRNRLVGMNNGLTASYSYDALGRRISKFVGGVTGGVTTHYFHHGTQVLEEQSSPGVTQRTYLHGGAPGEVVSMRGANPPLDFYYHTDDLGNVMAMTNFVGNIAERYEYEDYGVPHFFNAAGLPIGGTAIGNPLLFGSHRFDTELGFYQLGGRQLDPNAGRFTARVAGGLRGADGLGNPYTADGNSPWTGGLRNLSEANLAAIPDVNPIADTHRTWSSAALARVPDAPVLPEVTQNWKAPGVAAVSATPMELRDVPAEIIRPSVWKAPASMAAGISDVEVQVNVHKRWSPPRAASELPLQQSQIADLPVEVSRIARWEQPVGELGNLRDASVQILRADDWSPPVMNPSAIALGQNPVGDAQVVINRSDDWRPAEFLVGTDVLSDVGVNILRTNNWAPSPVSFDGLNAVGSFPSENTPSPGAVGVFPSENLPGAGAVGAFPSENLPGGISTQGAFPSRN